MCKIKKILRKTIFFCYKSAINQEYLKKGDPEYYLKIKSNKHLDLLRKIIKYPARFFLIVINSYFLIFFLRYDAIITLKNLTRYNENKKIKLKSKAKKIHPVYFCCRNQFPFLLLSLKSLEKLNYADIGTVFLYVDKNNNLTKKQINLIKKSTALNLKIKKTRYNHKQPLLVINELDALKEIYSETGDGNYINKLDSDVLFISDKIFKKTIKSNKNLIAYKESFWHPFVYSQGGCYFIKNSIIPEIISQRLCPLIKKDSNKRKKSPFWRLASESILYQLIKKKSSANKIEFDNFYFPKQNINKNTIITKKHKKKYSIIHFQGELKKFMIPIAREMQIKK